MDLKVLKEKQNWVKQQFSGPTLNKLIVWKINNFFAEYLELC